MITEETELNKVLSNIVALALILEYLFFFPISQFVTKLRSWTVNRDTMFPVELWLCLLIRVSDLRLSGREFDSPPPWGWVTVFVRINHLSISLSQPDNSASYPQWNGKWVPAKVKWRSVAREWRQAYSTSDERLPARWRWPSHDKWCTNKVYSSCMVFVT